MSSPNYDIIIAASEGRLEDVIQLYPQCNVHVFLGSAVYEAWLNKHPHVVEWFDKNVILNKKCLMSPLPAWSYEGELELLKSVIRIYDVNSIFNITITEMCFYKNGGAKRYTYTPLTAACYRGHEEIVRYLLSIDDINVNLQDNFGLTPLGVACENNHFEIVKILTQRQDIDVNALSIDSTPLVVAINNGFHYILEHLLKQDDINVNLQDNSGLTPLGLACENNHFEIVKILTQKQDIDVNGLSKGRTPLTIAVYGEYIVIIKHLLKQDNIQVNLCDSEGQTPLAAACRKGNIAIVELLTQSKDLDINKLSKNGSPLLIACANNHMFITRLLLMEHENIKVNLLNTQHKDSNTCLHYVIWHNREPTELHSRLYYLRKNFEFSLIKITEVKNLIFDEFHDRLINSQDNEGNTPLHLACMIKTIKRDAELSLLVRLLLSCGADVNITNNEKQTPVELAQKFNPKLKPLLNLVSLQNITQTEIWFHRLNILCLVVLSISLLKQLGPLELKRPNCSI